MTLFDTTTETTVDIDLTKEHLPDLVGEGKKFKTPEDLARAKLASDAFIESLKRENAEMRQDLQTRIKYEEFIDKMTTLQQPTDSKKGEPAPSEPVAAKPATDEDLARIVDKTISAREAEKTAKENLAVVKSTLIERFGPDYASKLTGQANALGLSKDALDNLAASNPKAFLKLFDVEKQSQNDSVFSPPRSNVNSGAFRPQSGVKNQAYYQKLKEADPKKYFSGQTAIEMHKEALAQGEAFFS